MLRFPVADPAEQATALGPGQVHLWVARLDPSAAQVAELRGLLDPDEIARADRFRFDVHRRRFIVGRGFQRLVLGAYRGVPAARVRYAYGPKGKPALEEAGPSPLYFNLSNSEELAILGLTREREIGVDVEYLRELSDLRELASRFFAEPESRELLALPASQQREAFFNCWTRKEAYLKAVGDGLSAPLDAFEVTLVPGIPARMVRLEGDPRRAAAWAFHHLEPADGYLGAVAIERPGLELAAWSWV